MPAEFETLSEQVALLKAWSAEPARVLADLNLDGVRADFGERHGSWFLRLRLTADEVIRTAELALTNATMAPDNEAEYAIVTVRASASSDERFALEKIYEGRRGVRRLRTATFEAWLRSAVERANGLSNRERSQTYLLGTPETAS
jgi:hypothetical protein